MGRLFGNPGKSLGELGLPSSARPALRAAIAIAKLSNSPQHFVGAAAFRGGSFLAAANNRVNKTHPSSKTWMCFQHAEFRLANMASISGATLVVVRINKSGRFCESKPCDECHLVLTLHGVRKVYHSTKNGTFCLLKL